MCPVTLYEYKNGKISKKEEKKTIRLQNRALQKVYGTNFELGKVEKKV